MSRWMVNRWVWLVRQNREFLIRTKDELEKQKDPLMESFEWRVWIWPHPGQVQEVPCVHSMPFLILPAQDWFFGPLRLSSNPLFCRIPRNYALVQHTHTHTPRFIIAPYFTLSIFKKLPHLLYHKILEGNNCVLFIVLCLAPKLSACNIAGIQQMFVNECLNE